MSFLSSCREFTRSMKNSGSSTSCHAPDSDSDAFAETSTDNRAVGAPAIQNLSPINELTQRHPPGTPMLAIRIPQFVTRRRPFARLPVDSP